MLALATLGAAAASSYAEESAACAAAGGAARVAEADLPDDGTCFQWDGVELANRSYCQPCLNGSYWDEFRDARAASRRAAATAAPVVVEMPYWLSGQLQASAIRILLEEVLGYAVQISLASAGSGSTARVAADCATLVPEFWYSEGIRKPEFETATKSGAVAKNQGALGQTRLFVTASAADPPYDKLIMDHYRSIKLNPAVVAALPAAGTWGAPDAAACGGAGWTNASCVNGTYAPPNCERGTCAEAYFVLPSWSESWYEGFLTAEGLNVTATYVGVSGMADVVEAAHNASRPVLFYWWDPDPLVARVPVLPLAATPFSSACEDRHAGDPTLSGANCLMNVDMLKAVAHAATLQADASLATFFAGYGADNDRQKAMMALETRGGGDLGVLYTSQRPSAAEEREFEDAEHEREERASMGADAAATVELSEAVDDPVAADEARKPAEAIRVRVIRMYAKLTTKWKPGQEKGDSTSLQHECSARARFGNSTHASRALREMIARLKVSRNERKTTEIGAFEVGNFAPFSCPGGSSRSSRSSSWCRRWARWSCPRSTTASWGAWASSRSTSWRSRGWAATGACRSTGPWRCRPWGPGPSCCPCFCCGRRCPTSAAGAATRRRRRRSSCFFSRSPWCR